jgi:hypothetical protein
LTGVYFSLVFHIKRRNDMKNSIRTTLISAALLLGTSIVSLQAAEVSVGGASVSTSGGSASAGTGAGVSGTATVGGGGGNVANSHFDANGNVVDLNIGNTSGPLAKVDQNGNPVNGTSASAAAINLGDLLEGIDVGGGGVTGGGGAGGVQAVVAGLSSGDRGILKVRCRDVLSAPASFKIDVVRFCRMVASM